MKKRIAILCMLCGVLVLSGCGGSSRVDDLERRVNVAEPLVEQLRRDLEIAQTEAETAKTTAEAAQLQAEAAQTRAALAEAAATQATTDKEAAETARDAAVAARDAAVADAAQARAERDTAVADAAQARAALQTAEAAQLAEEQRRKEEEARRAETEQAVINARAGVYITALDAAAPSRRTAATVEWMRGKSLEVDPGGNFASGSGAPGISGFSSYSFTRRVGVQGTETAYIYTNIQSPGTRAFWKERGLVESIAAVTAPLARVSSLTLTVADYNDDNNNGRRDDTEAITEVRVSGTYNNAGGTFTCTGAGSACLTLDANNQLPSITRDATSSVPTFPGGTWEFKPTNINNGVRIDQDDAFLYFGIWAREPDVASDMHQFEVIYGGGGLNLPTSDTVLSATSNGELSATAFARLTGRATFRGGAIGKYVTRNQVGENARIGTFTAQADFTAEFDDDPATSATEGPRLEGRITDFRESGQTLEGWDVYLGARATAGAAAAEPADFNTTGTVASSTGDSDLDGGVATARIGRVAANGTWTATLYGSENHTAELTADRLTYPRERYPVADLAGVAGYFEASDNTAATGTNANVAIVGAFGATTSNHTPSD